ncbi:preprotein translocase subunit SecE [Candidatus Uhrbacteria bacterium]|nr:preprotein translocase subunit SecE [Candidatus Uhrbacteria bacterium]
MKSLRLFQYFKESKEELKKVTWPSRQEINKYSLIIILLSLIIAGFFGGLDWLLNLGLEKLIEITAK